MKAGKLVPIIFRKYLMIFHLREVQT